MSSNTSGKTAAAKATAKKPAVKKATAKAPERISEVVEAEKNVTVPEVVQAPEVATIDLPATETLVAKALEAPIPEPLEAPVVEAVPSTGNTDVITGGVEIHTGEIIVAEVEEYEDIDTGAMPSRRDRLNGETSSVPEPVSLLTPERVLENNKKREAPTEGWNKFVYNATFHAINLGDSPAVRRRKQIDASISRRLDGGTRYVPVLTRKGGVGKTTVTTMLGMALARVRDDRIIAIDANPDRGTLAERFNRTSDYTVRDLVAKANQIGSFTDFSQFASRDKTRLDVLASDTDPMLSEAFGENDYNVVADLVDRYYSIALTDCGTGIVHSVMRATLQRADSLVIVSGGSFDEARLAAETLTWLESNGYTSLVRNSVVAINTATQGTNLVKIAEIESHFQSRVRDIVRIPYDPLLAAGSVIDFDKLRPETQEAARMLAALVVDGLPSKN